MQHQHSNGWRTSFSERLIRISYFTLITALLTMMLVFSGIYFVLASFSPAHGLTGLSSQDMLTRFLNSLYFSVITTTTVGYGDLVPLGVSKVFAAIQSFLGFSVAAFFVTKLLSFRQEMTLGHIHKLSFEASYQRIREGLYIMRKDFDAIMNELRSLHRISENSWENMIIASREGLNLLGEISDFYDSRHHSYVIDARREEVLIEAVQRTIARLCHLLASLHDEQVSFPQDGRVERELRTWSDGIATIVQTWRGATPHQNGRQFGDMMQSLAGLRECLGQPLTASAPAQPIPLR